MESTGKHRIPVYNILENACSIFLAHPKYVKAIRGKKANKKMLNDCWYFQTQSSRSKFMLPTDIRHLRDFMSYRFKRFNFISIEKKQTT